MMAINMAIASNMAMAMVLRTGRLKAIGAIKLELEVELEVARRIKRNFRIS